MVLQRNLIRDLGQSINALNSIFFSTENMDAIQASIIKNVYNFSEEKFQISRQSDQELGIVLREVYRQYSEYPQIDTVENIQKEINRLNDILVEKSVVAIIKNIKTQKKYIEDRDRGFQLQAPPIQTAVRGSRLSDPNTERSINNLGADKPHEYDKSMFDNLPW
jgi:hypothetical protein